jgi:hypothetical protein
LFLLDSNILESSFVGAPPHCSCETNPEFVVLGPNTHVSRAYTLSDTLLRPSLNDRWRCIMPLSERFTYRRGLLSPPAFSSCSGSCDRPPRLSLIAIQALSYRRELGFPPVAPCQKKPPAAPPPHQYHWLSDSAAFLHSMPTHTLFQSPCTNSTCHRRKLNVDMSPHRARCRDLGLTERVGSSAVIASSRPIRFTLHTEATGSSETLLS